MKIKLHNSNKGILQKIISVAIVSMITLNGLCVYAAVDTKSREYDFNKLIKGQESISLDELLKDYSPMKLNVFVNPEYINGVKIYNIANAGTGNITSIDISQNTSVAKFIVKINSVQYEAKLIKKGSSKLYNIGITTLENGDDIKIIAKNSNGDVLQTKVIKFNQSKTTNSIPNPRDLSKKGAPYTLQELIKKPNLLYQILKKNEVKLRTTIYLEGVSIDYQNNKLTNTTSEMEYSIDSSNGINGTWNICSDNETTNIAYGKSKKIFVREFSSKNNYLEVGNSNVLTPKYTIDYVNECTSEVIPSTVEYAEDINFANNKKDGQNEKIKFDSSVNIDEGQKTLYFRTKATDKTLPGNVFRLSIPARRNKPVFDIDYVHETTKQAVSNNIEYAEDISFTTNIKIGKNKPLKLIPGKTLFFRVKASSSIRTFVSKGFELQVKNRNTSKLPYNFKINYTEEKTSQIVPNAVEYSEDDKFVENVKKGTGQVIDLNPGDTEKHLYFRYAPTESEFAGEDVYTLNIKARSDAITDDLSIDFKNEKTKNKLSSGIQYAEDIKFTYNVRNSSGEAVSLNPGITYYFRKKSTEADFASSYKKLSVPPRPSSTNYSIDYENNTTVENIPTTVKWSNDENFSSANIGGNGGITSPLTIKDDIAYYFRVKASDSSFAGEVQELRKMPKYTINFKKEMTNEKIAKDIEWSCNISFSGATAGNDKTIRLEPGKTYYFRPRKSSQYHVQILEVPSRAKMSKIILLPGTNEGTFKLIDLQVGSEYEYIMSTSSYVPFDWGNAISLNAAESTLDNISSNGTKYIHIRVKSKAIEFASEILTLEIKVKEKTE